MSPHNMSLDELRTEWARLLRRAPIVASRCKDICYAYGKIKDNGMSTTRYWIDEESGIRIVVTFDAVTVDYAGREVFRLGDELERFATEVNWEADIEHKANQAREAIAKKREAYEIASLIQSMVPRLPEEDLRPSPHDENGDYMPF